MIVHPTYFPSISHYTAIIQAKELVFEVHDNFQKQTNRNRTYIYSPNGVQMLSIPVKHSKERHQKYKDVKIEYTFNWQKNHFKSLEAAYRSSPFFEFFEDDFRPVFEKKTTFLLDLNFTIFEIINNCLGINLPFHQSTDYKKTILTDDYRYLVNGKKDTFINTPYTQVFNEKHHFIPNLSVLDLLFNEGRNTVAYLNEQKITI